MATEGLGRYWQAIQSIDLHLDAEVAEPYQRQPLAQDWARVAKVSEEVGEAIDALILWTGQNPRKRVKGQTAEQADLLYELADVAITATLAIQHFTKDAKTTRDLIDQKLEVTWDRLAEYESDGVG